MLRKPAIFLIRIYQKTISPDHGVLKGLYPDGFCRYHPTCSEYTAQAIDQNGVVIGCAQGCWRIMRCNPWTHGGYDPPRQIIKKKDKSKKQ